MDPVIPTTDDASEAKAASEPELGIGNHMNDAIFPENLVCPNCLVSDPINVLRTVYGKLDVSG